MGKGRWIRYPHSPEVFIWGQKISGKGKVQAFLLMLQRKFTVAEIYHPYRISVVCLHNLGEQALEPGKVTMEGGEMQDFSQKRQSIFAIEPG